MKTNIALIGYMGTGKTAVGQLLAEKLGMNFIELDWIIEQEAGKPIPDIFREEGETGFREREIETTKKVANEKNSVIACGGGIVLNKINIDRLKERARIVYLTASPRTILKRVSGQAGQRPLLEVEDQLITINKMLRFRRPFYERAAEITINTSILSVEAVADQIIDKLKESKNIDE
jgi:shikimate kinase